MDLEKRFQDAVEYVHRLGEFGWKLGLERFSALCERLGSPHEKLRCVHVTGTNGKGSTTAMISGILRSAGYRVGTYYSPFVYDIRERVQVDGRMIDKESFARLVSIIKPHAAALADTEHGHPTEFEVKTALGFLYFLDRNVDFTILEVGLGGRLDATNIVNPLVSVITNVTMDHTDRLGETIPEIAGEKAGIIKPNGHLVTAAADPQAYEVIRRTCAERNSRMWYVNSCGPENCYKVSDIDPDIPGMPETVDECGCGVGGGLAVKGLRQLYTGLKLRMQGEFQGFNAATAVGAIEALQQKGFAVSEAAVHEGLENAYLPGRLEVLQRNPTLLIDGAHNLDGAQQVAQALKNAFTYNRLFLIMGMVSGHSMDNVIGALAPLAHKFIATQSASPRAASASEVAQVARKYCSNVEEVTPVAEAVSRALGEASPDDLVCVTGSFYTIGEVPRPGG